MQNTDGVGKAWALLVGISDYDVPGTKMLPLHTPTRDVDALSTFLQDPDGGNFYDVKVLKDARATQAEILEALVDLSLKADKNDLVLFYFSGHGYRSPSGESSLGEAGRTNTPAYLVPYDVRPSVTRNPKISCIGYDEIVDTIGPMTAEKVVVILDACHAGAFTSGAKSGSGDLVNRAFRDQWDAARGRPLLLSSGADEVSWEDKNSGLSVFTKYLLRGLQGDADAHEVGNHNAIVSFEELARYLEVVVPAYTRKHMDGKVQTPTRSYGGGEYHGDIPLAVNRPKWDELQRQLWDSRSVALGNANLRQDMKRFCRDMMTNAHTAVRAGRRMDPRQVLLFEEMDRFVAGETSVAEFELLARLLAKGDSQTRIKLTNLSLDVSPGDATVSIKHGQASQYPVSLPASQAAYRVPEGVYTIEAAKTGYRSESREGVTIGPAGSGGVHRIALPGYAHIQYFNPPQGVEVRVDGKPVTLPYQTVEGEHEVILTRPGFAPHRETKTLAKDDPGHLSPKWIRARAEVTIQSDPVGAAVVLGGEPRGVTPITLRDEPTGQHQLELTLDGYDPVSTSVDIGVGGEPIHEVLARSTGIVVIESIPDAATVVVNGKWVGVTPHTEKVPTGDATVTIQKARYRPVSEPITVAPGANVPLSITLERQEAELTIQSSPPGASVRLDARDLPRPTPTTEVVEPGQYTVSVTLPDYEQYIGSIQIDDRDEEILEVALLHKTQVRLTSEPAGLKVDLGDLGTHRTPTLLDNVEPGAYEARLAVKGYKSVTRPFAVEQHERNTLRLELHPKSRVVMLYRSALVPGFGQYAGDRKTSGGFFFATTVTVGVLAAVTHLRYGSAVDTYDDALARYANASTSADIQQANLDKAQAYDDVEDIFGERRLWLAVTGALWVTNIVHALASGPGLAEVGSQDGLSALSPHVDTISGASAGLSYRASF